MNFEALRIYIENRATELGLVGEEIFPYLISRPSFDMWIDTVDQETLGKLYEIAESTVNKPITLKDGEVVELLTGRQALADFLMDNLKQIELGKILNSVRQKYEEKEVLILRLIQKLKKDNENFNDTVVKNNLHTMSINELNSLEKTN